MKYFICTTILMLFSFLSFSQLEDVKIETRNGQRVYVHVIEKGNTLWGLHKLYDVSVEKIVENNPGVESGLQEGQTVYIPIPVVTKENVHTVAAGETLYSIARKYDIDVKDLIKWNPGCEEGIKVDQQLKIFNSTYVTGEKADNATVAKPSEQTPPVSNVKITFNDSIVEHKVAQGETLYSISKRYIVPAEKILEFNNKRNNNIKPGEILKIPLKKERIAKVDVREVPGKDQGKNNEQPNPFKKKEEYKVAILLPFMLNKGAGYSEMISNMSTEFLMGAQMAIDSLEQMGLKAKVYVYDTENNADKIRSILAKPELATMDLLIGPLNKANAPLIADWCLANKIRMVCPVNVDTKILQNNPYVYTTIGSDITLMKGLAKFMAQKFKGGKIVLIKPTNAQDSVLYQAFRSEYNRIVGAGGLKLIETTPSSVASYLSYSTLTALVYPTNDTKSATSFMNDISKLAHKMGENTYVFGTDSWLDMDGINAFYRNKYRITVPTSMDLNYSYERTKIYHRKYRTLYKSDFTKAAIQGFDVMYNFCMELLLDKKVGQLIMNDFESVQIGSNHGFENQNTEILTHDQFELKNISNGLE
jgi:LysM repeat protein